MRIRILIAQFLPTEGCRGNGKIGGHYHPEMQHVDFEDLGERHEQRRGEERGRKRLDERAQQEEGDVGQQEEHPRLVRNVFDPLGKRRRNLFGGHQPRQATRRADDQHDHLFFWDNRSPILEWLTSPSELYAPTLQFICISPKDDELEISPFLHR